MTHPEGTDTAQIIRLAQSFPSIANYIAVKEWDTKLLDSWAAAASEGERLSVQFVLSVWNQWEPWECGKFDVIKAKGAWDSKHWSAFENWVKEPFTL